MDKEAVINEIHSFCPIDKLTENKLQLYADILIKWNSKMNLVAGNTISELWSRHILDSAQLMKYIKGSNLVLTDFGSGAGFPAMILAILGGDIFSEIHVIESNNRKASFLREVAMITNSKVTIHSDRIENLKPWHSDIVTARAFTSLGGLISHALPFISNDSSKKNGICLLLKGNKVEIEINEAYKHYSFEYQRYDSIVSPFNSDENGYLLKLKNIKNEPYESEKTL